MTAQFVKSRSWGLPRPRRSWASRFALPLSSVALALLLVAVFAFIYFQDRNRGEIRGMVRIRAELATLFDALQNAETGQRGYLLTGDQIYLEPYKGSALAVATDLSTLESLMKDHPLAVSELETLRGLSKQKLVELTSTIDLRAQGKPDEALAIVKSGEGEAVMERVRASIARQNNAIDAEIASLYRKGEIASAALQLLALANISLAIGLVWLFFRRQREHVAELTTAHHALAKANRQMLEEAKKREELSEQLRQAQKMEAVGQLTGGIAHDFNNMLAIVVSGVNLAKRRMARGDADAAGFLDKALEGAERAATLVRRLLAFSRRQPLSPRPLDPNKMVGEMGELLRRTLGESVQLDIALAGGLWRAHADAVQLENIILNLAVNARDAMPNGGKLTIETSNAYLDDAYVAANYGISAGQYVMIAVTDTGDGMTPEVMQRAFDPFFTTKSPGQGTGLGLSQVFGFVRQSGGHVKVYSEVGIGTTLKVYLPRFRGDEEGGAAAIETMSPDLSTGGGGIAIIVVEDDESLLQMTSEALRELGYEALPAQTAAIALRHLDARTNVALIFTDVVMPEMNGRKLADEALKRRPDVKILFTSGYTANAIVHNGVLDAGVSLIGKPYTIEALARKIREVLAG